MYNNIIEEIFNSPVETPGITTDTTLQDHIDAFIIHVYKTLKGSIDDPIVFWIDLFSGAGGTSTGIHLAEGSRTFVCACVNHDTNAIYSHKENHPHCLHFIEDIRDFAVVQRLVILVKTLRKEFPNSVINIWASLECTNFSKAKGGLPRDADSRTLADHMDMYIENINPGYFWVENVREFMAWGPLDENGKPVSRTEGKDYIKWVNRIKKYGYRFDRKILNSADFGAYQSRERFFAQFVQPGLPISWPEQTHTKDKKDSGLFPMKRWRAVREILDLQDEGNSIFTRKKPLSENTLKRIYAGLVKFVANGETSFIKKYYSGRPEGKVISINGPAGTIKCVDGQCVVNAVQFISQRNTGEPASKLVDIDNPARTITATGGNQDIVSVEYLTSYYGNGDAHSLEEPCRTLSTHDRFNVMKCFIMNQYSNGGQHTDINKPCGSLTSIPKQNLITPIPWIMNTNFNNVGKSVEEPSGVVLACRKAMYLINANSSTCPPNDLENPAPSVTSSRTHYIVNPSWGGHPTSTDEPSVTVIARQDKAPLYLIVAETAPVALFVYDTDSPTMIKIKEFMCAYSISDIKMRMLNIPELKQIQGFPKDYILKGTQTEQKKYIGNAVEVTTAKALATANTLGIINHYKKSA